MESDQVYYGSLSGGKDAYQPPTTVIDIKHSSEKPTMLQEAGKLVRSIRYDTVTIIVSGPYSTDTTIPFIRTVVSFEYTKDDFDVVRKQIEPLHHNYNIFGLSLRRIKGADNKRQGNSKIHKFLSRYTSDDIEFFFADKITGELIQILDSGDSNSPETWLSHGQDI